VSGLRIDRTADGEPAMPGVVRRVDTSVPWPPPADPGDEYEMDLVDGGKVRGRVAQLWGQRVIIDQAGAVHCPYCFRFVPLDELAAADNSHPVGLRPISNAVLPLGDDPPGPWRPR
jgi:hypothetical protein